MPPVRGEVSAVSAYAIIWKETSFPAACFRLKLKRPTTDRLEDLCPFILAESVEELDYSFSSYIPSFSVFRQIFYNFSSLTLQ